jgi:ABC-type multidrug transport system fused ATPase/permease subunit
MKCMRITAGYTWTYHKTNTETAKELNITPVLYKIQNYRRNWIQHVNRMPCKRLPRLMKNYTRRGRRNQGRTLKTLLDEIGRGQQVAQIHDSYMMMTMMMMVVVVMMMVMMMMMMMMIVMITKSVLPARS